MKRSSTLFLKKDIKELGNWLHAMESLNMELDVLRLVNNKLIKKERFLKRLVELRRKTTLNMVVFGEYGKFIKNEMAHGKVEYDAVRAKTHEKYRKLYLDIMKEFKILKERYYFYVLKYHCP